MATKIIALVALFGASAHALTTASGHAVVVNKCNYDVFLNNVPAANEGAQAESKTLHSGDSYSQQYTGLVSPSGGDGWAIKLSKVDGSNQIMQYEYTWQPTGGAPDSVWFDMSYVNGDPFNGDWSFTSTNGQCQNGLTHSAYLTPTDDAEGMQQPCDCSDDVTLTLCQMPGALGSSSIASSSSAKATISASENPLASTISGLVSSLTSAIIPPKATASATAVTTSAAPIATSSATSSHTSVSHGHTFGFGDHEFEIGSGSSTEAPSSTLVATPTTFVTAVSSVVAEFFGNTIIEVETAWITSIVTAEGPAPTEARKRHEHHHAAAHHHE